MNIANTTDTLVGNHYTGQRNGLGLTYTIRNAVFEPTSHPNVDIVAMYLKHIDIAFKWKKPAIVSTHRLNFIGSIDPANRSQNLKRFRELLQVIVKRWPDVEFVGSDRLLQLLRGQN